MNHLSRIMLTICLVTVLMPVHPLLTIISPIQAEKGLHFLPIPQTNAVSTQQTQGYVTVIEYTLEFLDPQNNSEVWPNQFKGESLHLKIGVAYNESFTPTPTQVVLVHQRHKKTVTMIPQGWNNDSTSQLVTRYYNASYPWTELNVGKNQFVVQIYYPDSDTPYPDKIWLFRFYESPWAYWWDRIGFRLTILGVLFVIFSNVLKMGIIKRNRRFQSYASWGLLIFALIIFCWGFVYGDRLTTFILIFGSSVITFGNHLRNSEKQDSERR